MKIVNIMGGLGNQMFDVPSCSVQEVAKHKKMQFNVPVVD